MPLERFINQASAGWTTYGTGRGDFHCFRTSLIATRTTSLTTYFAERSAGAASSTSGTVAQTVLFALQLSILFSAPREPLPEDFSQRGRESGAVVGVADLSQRLGLCRVRMDGVRQRAQLQSVRDRQRQFARSEEHTSELQSRGHLVCRL